MQSSKKNIVAIPGSLRAGSSNHAILNYLSKLAPANINYTIFEGLAQIPHFDPGLDNDNPPAVVTKFRKLLAEADSIVICTPEYAFGVPGTLKNALDWTVSSGSLSEKPLVLITASTGGENAHAALLLILGALNANVTKETSLLISYIRSKMDGDGNITNEEMREQLGKIFNTFLGSLNL